MSISGGKRRADGRDRRQGARVPLGIARRAVAVATSCALVFGQVPVAAWAQDAVDASAEAAAQDELISESGAQPSAGEAAGAVEETPAETGPDSSGGASASGDAAADPADGSADAGTGASADASGAAPAISQQTPAQEDPAPASSDAPQSQQPVAQSEPAGQTPEAAPASDEAVHATVALIGPDAAGAYAAWAPSSTYEMDAGSTAADLIDRALADAGLAATVSGEGESWYLSSIVSPYTGADLGWDESTGRYWQLFVNGTAADFGAGQIELAEGDSVALCYSAYGDALPEVGGGQPEPEPETVSASVQIIGPDAQGSMVSWADTASYELPAGSTAADLTERILSDAGLTADFGVGDWGWYLNSITSPYTDEALGYDAATGDYWQLFVNGESASSGAGQIELAEGDVVSWAYTAYGEGLPTPGEGEETPGDGAPEIDPDAERPDYEATWSGFGNGGSTVLTDAGTPVDAAAETWSVDLKAEGEQYVSAGDPIIVGGDVYVTSSTELIRIDGATGKIVKRVSTGGHTSYFSRPVYADGVIIVPSDDGSLAAFTAGALACVWRTPALDAPANGGSYQANSTLTVSGGCVIAGFESGAGANGAASAGALVCVRISDGAVMWVNTSVKSGDSTGEGYYWAGAATSGDEIIIGDEGGRVQLIDTETGEVLSSVSIGMACRSTIVSAGTEDGNRVYLAVGRQPATLFKIVRDGDALRLAGQVAFAESSTSTPAVSGGRVYVGGVDASYRGVLAVIDLSTMTVADTYRTEGTGEVKASPLVSVQNGDTYVYFTSNSLPGAVYRYAASTGAVATVFTPADAQQNYCTASVIADANGNLYYTNDSGYLFCLHAADAHTVVFDACGGSAVIPVAVTSGSTVARPVDPTCPGYRFTGWYLDAACTVPWDFARPVTGPLTLYAGWAAMPSGAGQGARQSGSPAAGSATAPGSRPVSSGAVAVAGAVPAGRAPLSAAASGLPAADADEGVTAVQEEASASAEATGAAETGGAEEPMAAGIREDGASTGPNPWAVGGVAVGVVGLGAIGGYLAMTRNRARGGR